MKGGRCYRGEPEARGDTGRDTGLGLGWGREQGGGALACWGNGRKAGLREPSLCFQAQLLRGAVRADPGDGCGVGSQGRDTGPRCGSELHPPVPPAWCWPLWAPESLSLLV